MALEALPLGDDVKGKAQKVCEVRGEAVLDYVLIENCFDVRFTLVAGINSEIFLLVKGKKSDL